MLKFSKNYKHFSDEILMEKFGRGDSSAFEEIYRRYSSKLIYYFRKLLKNDNERAKDLMQDVFLTIVRNPNYFDIKKKFSVWIYKVAYNRFINEYHSSKLIEYTDELDEDIEYEYNFELAADNDYISKIIETEIERMSEKNKTTFILKYKENYSLQEIADVLGCPVGTVKSRLFNILKKLSKNLEKHQISKGFYYEK